MEAKKLHMSLKINNFVVSNYSVNCFYRHAQLTCKFRQNP